MISTLQQAIEYKLADVNKVADILTWAWQRYYNLCRNNGYSLKEAKKAADVFIGKGSPVERLSIEIGHNPTKFMLILADEIIKEYEQSMK